VLVKACLELLEDSPPPSLAPQPLEEHIVIDKFASQNNLREHFFLMSNQLSNHSGARVAPTTRIAVGKLAEEKMKLSCRLAKAHASEL
jgi:hypothetical protein